MILLVGASASGKTEIAKCLAKKYDITKAITHTTRPMREGERQDVDYHFVSEKIFEEMLEKDLFVEHTTYNGYHYGCSKAEIAVDKCVVLDPEGLKSFLALNEKTLVTFFLEASAKVREQRMRSRGDGEENIQKRLHNDEKAFSKQRVANCDYTIDSESGSVEELTDKIVELYYKHLGK